MHRRLAARFLPALLLAWVAFAPDARAERAVTLTDRPEDSACRFWDQYPDARKTVRWSGACRDGWANGPGVLEWSYAGHYDGRVEGTLLEGRLEGRARVSWRDGRRLDGTFHRGRASGPGVHVWPDGRVYEGEWRDDRRTGTGTLTFPSGNRYVGEFHRNRPTGEGEFVTAEGRRYRARLDARGMVGPGAPLDGPSRDRPPQSAAVPPAREEEPAGRGVEEPTDPSQESLEEWLGVTPRPEPRR
ncbi:hypothetical protein [Azospirillum sp. SYSU D00513]|uniref:MORN repeat-containing protein n=1 Tax=Azospirillum sp. SYSU D00513 TaxID=2812561 RepID=UPI001A965565|nr:hypothetical protein [Azospirillum sp. SYSU D00513]